MDAAWLKRQGYSSQLQNQYVKSGWLEQPARSVFRRPRGELSWQQVVISLQTILNYPLLVVGGRTSLELQGYAHYLRRSAPDIHLYGPKAPPGWASKAAAPGSLSAIITTADCFRASSPPNGQAELTGNVAAGEALTADGFKSSDTVALPWGQWDWPLTLSTPERALFELLDELPYHESFEQVDALFASLDNLRPARVQRHLNECASVKVKRLFLFFADRHRHAWRKRLKTDLLDLGRGKRMLVKGGVLDHTYQITVPKELNAFR